MSITVATVVKNDAAALPITLESALAQDHADLDVIVLDGASWDGTAALLRRYADELHRIEVVEDGGIYDAMNRAADLARKDFILFLNAGDRFHTEASLSKLWQRRRESAEIVYGDHIYRDAGIDTFKRASEMTRHVEALRRGAFDKEWLAKMPAHQATLTNVALLKRLRYDGAFRVCADHDLLMRAVHEGIDVQYVDEVVAYYAGGGFSARNATLCRLEFAALYRRYSEAPHEVDAALYGGASPFRGEGSIAAGYALFGLSPERPPVFARGITRPHRDVGPDGFRLRSPERRTVSALRLDGHNDKHDAIEVAADDRGAVRKELPAGAFSLTVPFVPSLPPAAQIDVVPLSRPGEGAPLVLTRFAFERDPLPAPCSSGVPLAFNKTAPGCREAVGSGWHGLEQRCMWSRGAGRAAITLAARESVEELAMTVMPNPAVPAQTLQVEVNGEKIFEGVIGGAPQRTLTMPLGPAWWGHGVGNTVVLKVGEARAVANDGRALGVALIDVTLR